MKTATIKEILQNHGQVGGFGERYLEVPGQLMSPTGKWVSHLYYREDIDVIAVYWIDGQGHGDTMALSALVEPLQEEIIKRTIVPLLDA